MQVSIDIVNKCLDLGVNFFDTAEAYSNHKSEEVLGKALLGRRRGVVIASKFGALKVISFWEIKYYTPKLIH